MAYSPKTWGKVKIEYETGNFSVLDLSKKHGIATNTIDRRIAKEGWIKGRLQEEIKKKAEESTLEMFARMGLPKEKLIEKIIEGLEANRTYIKKDGSGEGFIEVEPDHISRVKYIAEINKMTGGYEAEKRDVNLKTDAPIQINYNVVKGRSES